MNKLDELYMSYINEINDDNVLEEGKLINSILAAGSLVGSTLFLPKEAKADDSNVKIIERSYKESYDEDIDEKMDSIAKFLYINIANDKSEAEFEMTLIARTLASRLILYKEADTIFDLINKINRNNLNIKIDKEDRAWQDATKIANKLCSSPESFKWGFEGSKAPVYFLQKDKKPDKIPGYDISIGAKSKNFYYYRIEKSSESPKTNKPQNATTSNATTNQKMEINVLARVLYAETRGTSDEEFKSVCKVIMNRVGNKNFGNGSPVGNAYQVAVAKNAFSCINDNKNNNWWSFTKDNNEFKTKCIEYASVMMGTPTKKYHSIEDLNLPNISAVYYHDNSINMPKRWKTKYFTPKLVKSTDNFKFYKVIKNK